MRRAWESGAFAPNLSHPAAVAPHSASAMSAKVAPIAIGIADRLLATPGADARREVPHCEQNGAFGAVAAWQRGHVIPDCIIT